MFRRAWKPFAAATVLVGVPSYYYVYKRNQTFEITVKSRGPDGKIELVGHKIPLLPIDVVNSRLSANASSDSKLRPSGIRWNHATSSLASNDPIEDAHSHAIITRDDTDPSAPGDFLFFAVMDGHGGNNTSQLLSRVLINGVFLELSNLIQSHNPTGYIDKFKSAFWLKPTTRPPPDADPNRVSAAIQSAFTKLDTELLNGPLQVLAHNIDNDSRKKNVIPDLSKHPLGLATMLPAITGSCALMAVMDTTHRNLYVACTGDCRAVAGVWQKDADGGGSWRVEVLTEDQTGRNPNELKRMQSEHPADEADSVIQNGRVLGGLEPSRAFGDARYKWPTVIRETLNQAFMVGNDKPIRPPPNSFKTPPYVTATPVMTYRKIYLPTQKEDPNPQSCSDIRFLVLATDGLWDELSSEEVVSLVGGYLSGLKGTVPKTDLPNLVQTSAGSPTVEGKNKKRSSAEQGSWTFIDNNVSTHLIRNAFGGGNELELRKRLSIPAPYSRRFRDDVTVTVVWWEDVQDDVKMKAETPEQKIQAKL